MSIKLAIAGRPPVVLDETNITLGTAPGCSVTFDDLSDVKPKHAVIRSIAGRWLIEVRDAESILIGGSEPKRLHWLNPGDVFRLSESGPLITFWPSDGGLDSAAPPKTTAAPEVIILTDSDPSIPVTKQATISSPFWTVPQPKDSSSPAINVSQAPSSATYQIAQPPGLPPIRVSNSPPIDSATSDSEARESETNAPLLTRMTSWSGPAGGVRDSVDASESPEGSSDGGSRSDEASDVQWIKMVVGRCFFAGFLFVILWIAARELWNALVPPNYGLSSPNRSQTDT